jgi:tetratricopeptide (TPR) repeat protein
MLRPVSVWIRNTWESARARPTSTPGQPVREPYFTRVRNLAANLFAAVLVIAFLWAFALELTDRNVYIEPIDVPPELVQAGLNPSVVARRLADELAALQSEARTLKEALPLGDASARLDVTVPGIGMSLASAARFVKRALRLPDRRASGEISKADGAFTLTLRVHDGTRSRATTTLAANDTGKLMKDGAEQLLRVLEPYVLAKAYHQRERPTKKFMQTMKIIKECLADSRSENAIWALNLWGNMLDDEGDFAGAVGKYEAATKLDKEFPNTYVNWGAALTNRKQYHEAIEKYRKATDLKPDFALAHANWGFSLMALARGEQDDAKDALLNDAVARYQRATQIDPRATFTLDYWGDALREMSRYDEARAKYEQALQIDPGFARAHVSLGSLSLAQEDYEEAQKNYLAALQIEPLNKHAHNGLGLTLELDGDPAAAVDRFKAAIAVDTTFRVAHQNLARVLEKMGRAGEARRVREVIASLPGD